MSDTDFLNKIYSDPSHAASFSGSENLYRTVKEEGKYEIGMSEIQNFFTKPRRILLARGSEKKEKKEENCCIWSRQSVDIGPRRCTTFKRIQ